MHEMKRPARRAYSLVELLVSVALAGVVLAAGGTLLMQTFSNEIVYRQQNIAQQNARVAIGTIADEMKSARRKDASVTSGALSVTLPTDSVLWPNANNQSIASIASSTTPLYFNINNDDGTTIRRVRYWLNGTDLRREVVTYVDEITTPPAATSATGGTVIARYITSFTAQKPFSNTPSAIQGNYDTVRLKVTATQGVVGDPSQQSVVTLTTDVTLRNNLL